ncbi:hypothetical protein ACFLSJ_00935 [Verrucomicrobiota bacterium]
MNGSDATDAAVKELGTTRKHFGEMLKDMGSSLREELTAGTTVSIPGLGEFSTSIGCRNGSSFYTSGGPEIEEPKDIGDVLRNNRWRGRSKKEVESRVHVIGGFLKALLKSEGSVELEGFGTLRKSTQTRIDIDVSEKASPTAESDSGGGLQGVTMILV